MTKWAFDLSEELALPVLVRSVTRVSHARGNVLLHEFPGPAKRPYFDTSRPRIVLPVLLHHRALRDKVKRAGQLFEDSPFNFYRGPEKPELLLITCGSGWMYSLEAVVNLDVENRVGVLKLGTTWPLPEQFVLDHLKKADRILFVEEVNPFLEDNVKELFAQNCFDLGLKHFMGKATGTLPDIDELNPDIVIAALQGLLEMDYEARPPEYARQAGEAATDLVPARTLGFCAGCPHRATFWAVKNALALDGRDGFVVGDIGCYSLGIGPSGFGQMKTLHAMGSGTGLAGGFGQLKAFGLDQPIIAMCGDSTFYHAVMPALANARYNDSNFLLLLLDNSATAMTGFQPHPGTGRTATGHDAPVLDLDPICKALGAKVKTADPFDVAATTETILSLLHDEEGAKVLILRQECALVRARRQKRLFNVEIDSERCLGESCGCNRLCTRIFKCPGLVWNPSAGKARIDEAICTGCGVCVEICPASAITKEVA
jgi:indolepyruvate ferredoxin oxidoreductase alpha subunit